MAPTVRNPFVFLPLNSSVNGLIPLGTEFQTTILVLIYRRKLMNGALEVHSPEQKNLARRLS